MDAEAASASGLDCLSACELPCLRVDCLPVNPSPFVTPPPVNNGRKRKRTPAEENVGLPAKAKSSAAPEFPPNLRNTSHQPSTSLTLQVLPSPPAVSTFLSQTPMPPNQEHVPETHQVLPSLSTTSPVSSGTPDQEPAFITPQMLPSLSAMPSNVSGTTVEKPTAVTPQVVSIFPASSVLSQRPDPAPVTSQAQPALPAMSPILSGPPDPAAATSHAHKNGATGSDSVEDDNGNHLGENELAGENLLNDVHKSLSVAKFFMFIYDIYNF